MLASEFIAKWRAVELTERAAAQSHFRDLCDLLGEEAPVDADPKGEWYAFEKGATKTTGGEGWADVWKRGCFGWEYKRKGKNLREAFAQLQRYAPALENPPLLIVGDLARFEIHSNWTNTVSRTYGIALDDLTNSNKLRLLKWAFTDPEQLKPGLTRRRRRAADRRRARDQGIGGPTREIGTQGMGPEEGAEDRRRGRGRAHDSRNDRDRFASMFPNEHLFDEFGRRMIP
jgi:hypothetical protein